MYLIKLSLRELINSKKFALSFTFNLLLGLTGLCFVLSAGENIQTFFLSKSRELLSADIVASKRTPFLKDEITTIKDFTTTNNLKSQKKISTFTMVNLETQSGTKMARLINLLAIDNEFPYYGKLLLKKENNELTNVKGKDLYSSDTVWVSNDLFEQYKIKIGESLRIGTQNFTISGIIKEDSTINLGEEQFVPKIYISHLSLKKSKLIEKGSTGRYIYEIAIPKKMWNEQSNIKDKLLKKITNHTVRITASEDNQGRINRILTRLKDYLALIAISALFLSMIGLGNNITNYLLKKRKEIGILKSLGLSENNILALYFYQITFLVFTSCILSIVPVTILLSFLNQFFIKNLNTSVDFFISFNVLIKILGLSLILLFLLSIPIIKMFASLKTVELLSGEQKTILTFKKFLYLIPYIYSFHPLCVWQSKSWISGSIFYFALLFSFLVGLSLIFFILKKAKKSLDQSNLGEKSYPLSLTMAYRYLIRDPLNTNLAISSIMVGICLSTIIFQMEKSFINELIQGQDVRPSLFLFDIQEDQSEDFTQYLDKNNIRKLEMAPMIRGRITKINDKKFVREDETKILTREDERRFRMKNRGINLTFKDKLNDSEEIVEGRIWSKDFDPQSDSIPEISIEKRYSKTLDVKVNDIIEFDIMGVPIKGKITSLRRVRWTSFLPNFFITFQPGVLEDAPKTFVAALESLEKDKKNMVSSYLAEKFPNVSQVNVFQVIENIYQLFRGLSLSIKYMAIFSLLVGLVVLSSIFKLKIDDRIWDMGMLKVLGFPSKKLGQVLWWELFFITIMSVTLGIIIGIMIGLPLTQNILELKWFFIGKEILIGLIILLIITYILWWSLTRKVLTTPAKNLIE